MSHPPAINEQSRCTYRTADGRRCQTPFAPNHTSLCTYHAIQDLQLHDSKVVTEEIVGPLGDFRSAFAINRALGKLFTITAENRIPVRNATVLAYIGQLLLQTLRPLRNEVGSGGIEAIVCDTIVRLGDELPKVPPFCRKEASRPPMKALVKESLAILKEAGLNIFPELVRNVRDYDAAGEEEDNDDGISDGGGINDDDANSENAVAGSG